MTEICTGKEGEGGRPIGIVKEGKEGYLVPAEKAEVALLEIVGTGKFYRR